MAEVEPRDCLKTVLERLRAESFEHGRSSVRAWQHARGGSRRDFQAVFSHIQGMGLGLYVSRHIVEAHGGRLWAESGGESQGARFNLWLPLAGMPAASGK
jgi:Histidine kinase-, DNA gyrase B-, and HSP90-like ATPase